MSERGITDIYIEERDVKTLESKGFLHLEYAPCTVTVKTTITRLCTCHNVLKQVSRCISVKGNNYS